MTGTPLELSATDARRLALRVQGLLGRPPWPGRPAIRVLGMLRGLGAVQLDTISVLARSHELVAYARLGPVGRTAVERAYWGPEVRTFEYWSHAACILPIEEWPWSEWRRRSARARALTHRRAAPDARADVLARLRELGPVTTVELGGAKNGGLWWDWSPMKVAVEELLNEGVVVCTRRRGWRRVYDLAERAVPHHLLAIEPSDAECRTHALRSAAARLGVATLADLADYHRLQLAPARAVLADSGLVEVRVEGWGTTAWALPETLAAPPRGGRHRTTLLSPFDSLIWDRPRTARVFGFVHRLEAYTPAPLRVHGYFTMPLLCGGRLRGRVDPVRRGRVLLARTVSLDPTAVIPMATALREAAEWVGCDEVALGRVTPEAVAPALARALQA